MKPATILVVNGLKRAGNHVIINWLMENTYKVHKNWINGFNQHYKFSDKKVKSIKLSKNIIYSFEDITYNQLIKYIDPNQCEIIAITRSIDNLISSRIIAFIGKSPRTPFSDYIEHTKNRSYTDYFIEKEANLINAFYSELKKYDQVINYDNFISSDKYRKKLLTKVSSYTEENTKSLEKPTIQGDGSSFLPKKTIEKNICAYKQRRSKLKDNELKMFNSVKKRIKLKDFCCYEI